MATEKDVVDLAQEAMVKSIITTPAPAPQAESPCSDSDSECNQRWIQAFSDCC